MPRNHPRQPHYEEVGFGAEKRVWEALQTLPDEVRAQLAQRWGEPERSAMVLRDGEFDEWQRLYLFTRSDTIYGGSNEIQRGIIAKAILGL